MGIHENSFLVLNHPQPLRNRPKHMNPIQFLKYSLLLSGLSSLSALSALGQGALTPPDAPAPSMKTLDQISSQISGIAGDGRKALTVQSLETKVIGSGSYYLLGNANFAPGVEGFSRGIDDNGGNPAQGVVIQINFGWAAA